MSRSNHNYYNLCVHWGEIGEDGYCDFHRLSWWKGRGHLCIPPGAFTTRRGVVQRKARFPEYSMKTFHRGPPSWWWRSQHRRARAIQAVEFHRDPEDPMITPDRRLITLYNWY